MGFISCRQREKLLLTGMVNPKSDTKRNGDVVISEDIDNDHFSFNSHLS